MSHELPAWITSVSTSSNPANFARICNQAGLISLEQIMREQGGKVEVPLAQQIWTTWLHIAAWLHGVGRSLGEPPADRVLLQFGSELRAVVLVPPEDAPPPAQLPTAEELFRTPELTNGKSPSGPQNDLHSIAVWILALLVGPEAFTNDAVRARVLERLRQLRPDLPDDLVLFLWRHLEPAHELRPDDIATEIRLLAASAVVWAPRDEPATGLGWSQTDPGMRKRLETASAYRYPNEDAINQDAYVLRKLADDLFLIGVFDGVSTCTLGSGGEAAQIACNHFQSGANFNLDVFRRLENLDRHMRRLERWLREALQKASELIAQQVYARYAADPAQDTRHTMISTATVALVWQRRYVLAWLGDSPAFVLGPLGAVPLVSPHDGVDEALRNGRTIPQTYALEESTSLTRFLGGVLLPEDGGNEYRVQRVEPSVVRGFLPENHALMLASDGVVNVHGKKWPSFLRRSLRDSYDDSQKSSERLLGDLFHRIWTGASAPEQADNITLVVHMPVAEKGR